MPFKRAQSIPGRSHQGDGAFAVHRALPEEVPVAMVYNGTSHAVMMATPADIEDFALGFALTEGVVERADEFESFEVVHHEAGIEARAWLSEERAGALGRRRRAMAGPVGCGLCGIDSLEEASRALPQVGGRGVRLSRAEVAGATDALRGHQPLHDRTRATHAAGFLRPGGGIVMAREDVGRHNALDKLIGGLQRAGIDPAEGAFVMTSRLSVELIQKGAMAGCPVMIAVSAPTAHALRLAEGAGMTLAAFARGGGFDLYAHPHRIIDEVTDVA
ncbi:formate dehydrogenase accessory sulfurtransferase FdhD [Marimonas lutisalis]|uniref:formate dehydrogenase accessory sulfurtransferase FdhD n=1 Tax=Marimonas lutisalis TaxID=2545756 RepID=UPI0010F8E7AD|nr:formate dehydrogenase accessory sulfurtransferase FdhD [Marimonas lutisalis]